MLLKKARALPLDASRNGRSVEGEMLAMEALHGFMSMRTEQAIPALTLRLMQIILIHKAMLLEFLQGLSLIKN